MTISIAQDAQTVNTGNALRPKMIHRLEKYDLNHLAFKYGAL